MWLNIRWYNGVGALVSEDGAYGPIGATVTNPADGTSVEVESILDLHDTNTRIYEAHYGMTKEWASQLVSLGYPADMPLSFDRYTGAVDFTLGDLASQSPGTVHETFHFVLNNSVVKDNRIPPYEFSYDEARKRNALPVPADQYGDPGAGGSYNYWDELTLSPPAGATYAEIDLLYQGTSWEYVQFLWRANTGANAFLADEGVNMLEAWINTGMVQPYVMASTVWGSAPAPATPDIYSDQLNTYSVSKGGALDAQTDTFRVRDTVAFVAHVVDEDGVALSGAQVFLEVRDSVDSLVTSLQGFSDDTGNAVLKWKTMRNQPPGQYSGTVVDLLKNGFAYDPVAGVQTVSFTLQ